MIRVIFLIDVSLVLLITLDLKNVTLCNLCNLYCTHTCLKKSYKIERRVRVRYEYKNVVNKHLAGFLSLAVTFCWLIH